MGLIRRRRRRDEPAVNVGVGEAGASDVRIVGPATSSGAADRPSEDATGELADDFDRTPGGSVLDELSSAFGSGSGDGADDDRPGDDQRGDGADERDEIGGPVGVLGTHDSDDVDDGTALDTAVTFPTSGTGDGASHAAAGTSHRAVGTSRAAADTRPTPRRGATIAIGGDDELPDAVYLDDERGIDGAGTVFIDDDGQGDAILPQDATGPGIEPRLRQRRIGVRRSEGRRRLKWVAVGAFVLVVLVAVLAVLGSGFFAIDDVRVSGQQYADQDAVQAVVDDLVGTPTLLVDVDDAERRLEEIPWVEQARVRTDFPDSATVELRERVPLATVRGVDQRYRIIDREGRVLAIEDGQPIAPVLITGPGTLDLSTGQFADIGYAAAANLVSKLTPEVRSRLVSMSATPDGSDLRLVLSNELLDGEPAPDIEVRLGAALSDNEQFERLVRLERVLDDVEGGGTTIIDVSTEESTER